MIISTILFDMNDVLFRYDRNRRAGRGAHAHARQVGGGRRIRDPGPRASTIPATAAKSTQMPKSAPKLCASRSSGVWGYFARLAI
jgi:hypothetical protein